MGTVRHLRFSPDEYRLLAGLWHQLGLGGHPRTARRGLLTEALSGPSPDLAQRITRLTRSELGLLFDHFWEPPQPAAEPEFTPEELRVVLEACVSPPSPVRFVHHFKGVLVELLQEAWPELSRKVARLNGRQFERLYERAGR
jgi:hypothetical protein